MASQNRFGLLDIGIASIIALFLAGLAYLAMDTSPRKGESNGVGYLLRKPAMPFLLPYNLTLSDSVSGPKKRTDITFRGNNNSLGIFMPRVENVRIEYINPDSSIKDRVYVEYRQDSTFVGFYNPQQEARDNRKISMGRISGLASIMHNPVVDQTLIIPFIESTSKVMRRAKDQARVYVSMASDLSLVRRLR